MHRVLRLSASFYLLSLGCTRYMKWNLGRGIGLVARCEYDAIMPTQQGKVFINIKALNEWDSKVDA